MINIISSGSSIGSIEISNDFFKNTVNKESEWIYKKTGILNRYIVSNTDEYYQMILKSANECIEKSNINKDEIGLLILATSTPNNLFGDSSFIASQLELKNIICFDISVACNGFITGLVTAMQYLKNSNFNYALVIGADCLSKWVDWNDYKTSILFGDGAGSVILSKKCENGIIDYIIKHNGNKNNLLKIEANKMHMNNSYSLMNMNGYELVNEIILNVPNLIIELLNKNKIKLEDVSYFILHQANKRLLEKIAIELNVKFDKFLTNIENIGNTSAASIPILIDEINNNKIINFGDVVVLCGFGAGINYGAILLKWN